jgi:signal peptidase I
VAGREMPIDMGAVRRLWRAIGDIGDAEFITVDSEDATVRVSRAGDWLLVNVEECGDDGGETVDIRVPVAVLDALFSGDGDTLDIGAAVERLADLRGDIIQVRGDDHQVRVWIDEIAHASQ